MLIKSSKAIVPLRSRVYNTWEQYISRRRDLSNEIFPSIKPIGPNDTMIFHAMTIRGNSRETHEGILKGNLARMVQEGKEREREKKRRDPLYSLERGSAFRLNEVLKSSVNTNARW